MQVLHLAPAGGSGIATYGERFRGALSEAGVDVLTVPEPPDQQQYVRESLAAARGASFVHAELGGGCNAQFRAAQSLAAAGHPTWLTLHDPPGLVWRPFERAAPGSRATSAAVAVVMSARARTVERALLQAARGFFTLTHGGLEAVRRAFPGAAAGRGSVLPFPLEPLRAAAQPRGDRDQLVVGFHGYWYRSKGLEDLVEAVALVARDDKPIRLVLWGEPLPALPHRQADAYRGAILRTIDRHGIWDLVEVAGPLPDAELRERLATCDVIALPYRTPGRLWRGLASTSAALHDALAAGVPVITTRVKALDETVRHMENGLLVRPHDAADVASAVRAVRDDPALRARLQAGAVRTAAELTPARTAAAALAAYCS